jgi:N6-L-threonylcarbamoyladenine synthase
MIVLGIETSCDDTSAAIFDGKNLLANVISTQLIHRNFGGIVPELASRAHIQLILPVIRQTIDQAHLSLQNIEGIAVTRGPGLAGSLLVGLSVAKGLSFSLQIPFIGINHLEGHIWANRLHHESLDPPFITLIVSGGHTQLVHVTRWGKYKVIGRTRDDAAGEAFDKVGKLLGLGYPGGPAIENHAKTGNDKYVVFPRAYLKKGSFDFSFSGLKTSVLNHVHAIGPEKKEQHLCDIARCFQDAVVDVLVEKTIRAAQKCQVDIVCLAGGVAVNKALQQRMKQKCSESGISVLWPPPMLCTDNGGMIACAGHDYLTRNISSPLSLSPLPSENL